jgi:RNA polymerase sigma-70 factor (ECF subfamily)
VLAGVFALCGDAAVAEELTQEAFLRAHQHWERIGHYDQPELWVRRVALNLATSWFRRRAAERRALDRASALTPPAIADLSAPSQEVWAAVRALPRRQAQVVVLTYVDDLAVDDVGRALGIAASTVRVLLHRSRARLADMLSDLDTEEVRP